MNKWIKYDDVVALLKAHAQDGDNLTLISDETAEALENIPSIDMTYCKECKHWRSSSDAYLSPITKADDFCSYGER